MYEAEKSYYSASQVPERIIEYCGGSAGKAGTCTARFLVTDGNVTAGLGIPKKDDTVSCTSLPQILDRGVDVFRSLWDRESVLAIVDLDYQNADFTDEALSDPMSCFSQMESLFQIVRHELVSLEIDHIAVMTGQGYHFAWRIGDFTAAARLQTFGQMLPTLEAKYTHDHPFTNEAVPLRKGRNNSALGLLLEYVVHRILRASGQTTLPTVVTGLVVGAPVGRRASVSLDLSAYGDPLHMRYTHCAFSVYHRARHPGLCLVCLPRAAQSWQELAAVRSDLKLAAEYAGNVAASIPEAGQGVTRLIGEYLASDLRRFHTYFESGRRDDPKDWPTGYDRLDLHRLPPCVSLPLSSPNDALPKPNNMQNISRVLVSQGWHPRAVAGLICSKFERDFGWGSAWLNYDAGTRADFYVRLFCGLIATGLDDLRDFNCVSHQEQGFCPRPWCGFNLADYREPLLKALR
jgi:hypothetical protein